MFTITRTKHVFVRRNNLWFKRYFVIKVTKPRQCACTRGDNTGVINDINLSVYSPNTRVFTVIMLSYWAEGVSVLLGITLWFPVGVVNVVVLLAKRFLVLMIH